VPDLVKAAIEGRLPRADRPAEDEGWSIFGDPNAVSEEETAELQSD